MDAEVNGVILGDYADQEGGLVYLSDEDRRRHLYVLGKSGVGKTTLIRCMIQSDLERGLGLALIDPHGDLAEQVADSVPAWRENDVVYIDPSDPTHCVGFNPLYRVPAEQRPLVATQILASFAAIWNLSLADQPRLLYVLYNCVRLLLDTPGTTLLGIQKLLVDDAYRRHLLRSCQDAAVRNFFVHELGELSDRDEAAVVGSVQNKIGMLLTGSLRSILSQPTPTINVRRAMDNNGVIILNLSKGKNGEGATHLLGASFMTAFAQAAEMRATIPEHQRKLFTVYAEEMHAYATDTLSTTITDSRKWALALVCSHQTIAQTPPVLARTIVATVGSLVAFRLGGADAEVLRSDLKNTEHVYDQSALEFINVAEPLVLTYTANFQAWAKLLENGVPTRTRLMHTRPPAPSVSGRLQAVRNRSRARHLRPRAAVEEKLDRFLNRSVPRVIPT